MKLWLKDFEHNISPATWQTAEILSQDGRVRNLREIETHFWVARVDTEELSYETEMIITPHKIKAYACECFSPGRRLMCPHIAATLLKIRQFLEQRAEERRVKAEAARSNEISRLTVQSVLENATQESMEAFVRDYARRDRDFALALKTWFAGFVTEAENPYILVLDSVLPKTMPPKGYRDPEFRRVRKALDGLESQLEKYTGEHNYRGIYLVSTAILQRTLPLLEKMDGNRREALMHFCDLSLKKLVELGDHQLSAELHESAWEFVFELGKSGKLPDGLARSAIQFLTMAAAHQNKAARIRQAFDLAPFPADAFLLQLFLASLASTGMPAAIPRVLDDYLAYPDRIREAILQLYYLHHWPAVLAAGDYFWVKGLFQGRQQQELEDILIFIAEKSGERERLIQFLRRKFMQSGYLETFRKLKEAAAEEWPKVREIMVEELSAAGSVQHLAAALAADDQLPELAELLEREGTLALLQRYENYFFQDYQPFLQERYTTLLAQYLDEHFGTPAAQYIRLRLSELWSKGQQELTLQIAKVLIAKYPERPNLGEELAELLPKTKRKALFL